MVLKYLLTDYLLFFQIHEYYTLCFFKDLLETQSYRDGGERPTIYCSIPQMATKASFGLGQSQELLRDPPYVWWDSRTWASLCCFPRYIPIPGNWTRSTVAKTPTMWGVSLAGSSFIWKAIMPALNTTFSSKFVACTN